MPAKQNVRNQNNSTCEFSETDDAGEPHRELIKEEKPFDTQSIKLQ